MSQAWQHVSAAWPDHIRRVLVYTTAGEVREAMLVPNPWLDDRAHVTKCSTLTGNDEEIWFTQWRDMPKGPTS